MWGDIFIFIDVLLNATDKTPTKITHASSLPPCLSHTFIYFLFYISTPFPLPPFLLPPSPLTLPTPVILMIVKMKH